MTTEEKIKEVAEKYGFGKNGILSEQAIAFIEGAKSDSAKEYWIEKFQKKVNLDEEIEIQYKNTGSLTSENILKRGFSLGLYSSKEYWYKEFKKEKLEFAIEQLKSLEPTDYDIEYSSADLRYFRNELRKRRVELEQKLSEL